MTATDHRCYFCESTNNVYDEARIGEERHCVDCGRVLVFMSSIPADGPTEAWNQAQLDAARTTQKAEEADAPTIKLTPAILRALGEGVDALGKGDSHDCAMETVVKEALDALGYQHGSYDFWKKG